MSIGNRVDEAIKKINEGDFENALIQLSIAIDATSKKKFKTEKKVGKRIKKFILENQNYIMHFQMGGQIKVSGESKVNYGDKGNIADVLYKFIRCALLHEADISKQVIFREGTVIGMHDNRFIVSDRLLKGLVLLIVGQEVNVKETLKSPCKVLYNQSYIQIEDMWGEEKSLKL